MKKFEHPSIDIPDEDMIDIKEIFSMLFYYKKSIAAIILLSVLFASYRAYFSPYVYTAQSLLKISPSSGYGYSNDFLNMYMYSDGTETEDELVVFKSRSIAQKALETLNIGTRYYTTKYLKTKELYKDSPFVVKSEFITPKLHGVKFELIPMDEKSFRLILQRSSQTKSISEDERSIEYNNVHQFSEKIDTEWFTITVQKIYPLSEQTYQFSIAPNESMIGFIQAGISAKTATKYGRIIELSFSDNVALRAKEIVDSVVNAYIAENIKVKSEAAKKKLYFIDMQLQAINETLEGSAKKLQTYKATNIVVDLSSQAKEEVTKLSELESDLYELKLQTDILENILNHINTKKEISGINMDYSQHASPVVSSILKEIQQATEYYATLSVNYTEIHPGIIKVKRQIQALKGSLKEAILSNLRTLEKRKISLLNMIAQKKSTLQNIPEQEQMLEQLTRNFMVNEKIYSFLLEKRAETAIVESSTVSNIRTINAATIPSGTVKPTRSFTILLGIVIGLILGIVQALLRHYLDNTIKTSEDIEKLTKIPLYGTIPLLKTDSDTSHYNESIRSIWVNLEFLQTKNRSKVFSVTSSIPDEGKTLTIYNLATLIAQSSNKSVIIIDLDMRRPSLHEKFDVLNTEKGISTLLSQKYTINEVTQETKYKNLKLITSGPKPPNPTALIMSKEFDSIIDELSQKYDYILLDSPPIGLVADARKIMHVSDITLFLTRASYSKKEYIKEINRLNEIEEINLGIILNGVDFQQGYGYQYNSKYHHDYYS